MGREGPGPAAHLYPLPGSPKAPSQTPMVLKNITGPLYYTAGNSNSRLRLYRHCHSAGGDKPLSLVSELGSQPLMTGPAKLLCVSPPAVGGGYRAPAWVGFQPSGLPYF